MFRAWADTLGGIRHARIKAAKTATPKVFCPTTRLAPELGSRDQARIVTAGSALVKTPYLKPVPKYPRATSILISA